MRVIPAIDLLGGRVVRLHRGDYTKVTVYHDDPLAVVQRFAHEGADWLHLVDLDGARDGTATQAPLVERVLAQHGARLRVQVGGGVRTLDQVRAYAAAGAARVVLGTRAVEDPDFVTDAARVCPIVAAVDAREGKVATHGWLHSTDVNALSLASALVARGASAVLYTDIARDGTGEGPNVEATAALARALPGVEVIASGGIGSVAHLRALASYPEIASCIVGRALYERSLTVREALEVAR
jgi:phosphoribosylformimino-5-aminoimidazole carboxamide ribotide isomerase